jgi:hypothetical protein
MAPFYQRACERRGALRYPCPLSRTLLCGIALAASSVLLVVGCGGSGSKKNATTTSTGNSSVDAMGPRPAETKAAIRQNWQTFFDGSSSASKRVSLAQNGEQVADTIAAVSNSSLAKQASAKVTSVKIDGPASATVTYTLLLNGSPVLTGVKGSAVLENGTWKVSIASLCALAALQGSVPKACPPAGK